MRENRRGHGYLNFNENASGSGIELVNRDQSVYEQNLNGRACRRLDSRKGYRYFHLRLKEDFPGSGPALIRVEYCDRGERPFRLYDEQEKRNLLAQTNLPLRFFPEVMRLDTNRWKTVTFLDSSCRAGNTYRLEEDPKIDQELALTSIRITRTMFKLVMPERVLFGQEFPVEVQAVKPGTETPDTAYCGEVRLQADLGRYEPINLAHVFTRGEQGRHTFQCRISGLKNSPDDFYFVVMGDSRPNQPRERQPAVFKEIMQEVQMLKPAFVLHTGDIILGPDCYGNHYQEFKEIVSLLTLPVYVSRGNHDDYFDKFDQARGQKAYYSFDYGNSHFTLLDFKNQGYRDPKLGIDPEQLAWLKNDLAQAQNAKHRFVVLHPAFFPVTAVHAKNGLGADLQFRDQLHEVLRSAGVEMVFSGHEHIYYRQEKDGITHYTTGGAGAPLHEVAREYWRGNDPGSFYHYLLVHVQGDKVDVDLLRPGSRLTQRFLIQAVDPEGNAYGQSDFILLEYPEVPWQKAIPPVPTGITVQPGKGGKAVITWKDVPGETGETYRIFLSRQPITSVLQPGVKCVLERIAENVQRADLTSEESGQYYAAVACADRSGKMSEQAVAGRNTTEQPVALQASGRKLADFVQITDCHFHYLWPRQTWALKDIFGTLRALDTDFVIDTGDMTENSLPISIAGYKYLVSLLSKPYYFSAGNHDAARDPKGVKQVWGEPHQVVRRNNCFFLSVYSTVFNSVQYQIGPDDALAVEALQFIEQELNRARDEKIAYRFLFFHIPPFWKSAEEKDLYQNWSVPYRKRLSELCQKYGVDAIICGHNHENKTDILPGGTEMLVTGTPVEIRWETEKKMVYRRFQVYESYFVSNVFSF